MGRALLFVTLCLSTFAAGSALARPATEAEKAALDQVLTRFEDDMDRRDMAAVIAAMPPRIIPRMAEQSGMSVEQLKAMVVKLSDSAMDMVGEFGFEHRSIEFKELANGTPFALVPTSTVINMKDGPSYRVKSHTLALLEDGNWYVMRVEEPKQLMILHGAYPDFVGVELPQGSMELLED